MANIKKLQKGDLKELLKFLNYSFTGDPNSGDFESTQPKIWFDDAEHMEKHYAIREGGSLLSVLGIYPFDVTIAGESFKFATTGNMGTAPETRGRGYMSQLYENANLVLKELGVDVARLEGKRSRYARFGYEHCGYNYKFYLTHSNATERIKKDDLSTLTLKEIKPYDSYALGQVRRLYLKNGIAANRGDDNELYLTLIFSHNTPYGAYVGEKMVGYFTVVKGCVCEASADSSEFLVSMLCKFVADTKTGISIKLPPDRPADLKALSDVCENMFPESASQYKILNWAKLVTALFRLKSEKIAPLVDGELVLEIKGFGSFKIFVENGVGGCEKTEKPADLVLSELEASRFLFGVLPPFAAAALPKGNARFITANLPLPLYTLNLDKA